MAGADDVTISDLLLIAAVELGAALLCATATSNEATDGDSLLRRHANMTKWRDSLKPLLFANESLAQLFDSTRLTAFFRSCLGGTPNFDA